MVEAAAQKLESLPSASAGLSPHAPYSTSPELLSAAATAAREHGWLLTTHVAESADEFDMYLHSCGAMFDWLKSQRDMSDCGISPVAHLARHGVLSPNFLAVHVNYLAQGDVELLARSGASVVHCPGSHAYFHHRAFPFEELDRGGINICLGTDSLATMSQSPQRATGSESLFRNATDGECVSRADPAAHFGNGNRERRRKRWPAELSLDTSPPAHCADLDRTAVRQIPTIRTKQFCRIAAMSGPRWCKGNGQFHQPHEFRCIKTCRAHHWSRRRLGPRAGGRVCVARLASRRRRARNRRKFRTPLP